MASGRRGAEFIVTAVLDDLKALPPEVIKQIGFDIGILQDGDMPDAAGPMRGFDPQVIEIRADEKGDTYRCCVTVRLAHRVYVLHVFKKKSKKGDETPQKEIDTIRRRLQRAVERDAEYGQAEQEKGARRGA